MTRFAAFAFFLISGILPLSAQAERQMEDAGIVVLRTVDKLSARTHTYDIPVDKTVKFGNSLFIKARACRKSSPLDTPESAAFLQIWERKPNDEKATWVFSGWMFASNPSVSAMDHQVYDVWVIDCKNVSTASKSEEFSSEKAPEKAPENVVPAPVEEAKTESATPATAEAEEIVEEEIPPSAEEVPEPEPTAPAPPEEKPAEETPSENKPAEGSVPPLEKLPSSFEDEAAPVTDD